MSFRDLFSSARRAARMRIDEAIRRGVLSLEEIAFHVSLGLDEELADDVLASMVAESWKRLSVESAKLPRPTPLEHLQAAFDTLDRAGIMARHYPLAGRADALSLVQEELCIARRAGHSYSGYCFYDRHSLGMMSDGALAFCFGPDDAPKTYAQLWGLQVEVAKQIVSALQREGFSVDWSGKPADVISIDGVNWSGPRDSSGSPTVPIGRRLDGDAPEPRGDRDPGRILNVFVACTRGAEDAHRLLAQIAVDTGSPVYGAIETFETEPLAVAVQVDDGLLLDLVASESDPSPRGLLRGRDLANECTFLVAMASDVAALDCPWWSIYPPDRRLLILTGDAAGTLRHQDSRVLSLNLSLREDRAVLLDAVRDHAAASLPSP